MAESGHTTAQDEAFARSMDECARLCMEFDRAAYQLVRFYGATPEALREQLEEAIEDV